MKPQNTLDAFNDTLSVCDLFDLGFTGHGYTWWNGQKHKGSVEERLDRYCADSEWSALFPNARITTPIVLNIFESHSQQKKNRRKHFEHFWALDDRCEEVISKAWQPITSVNPIPDCVEKIKRCMAELSAWSYSTFGNIQHEIHKCKTLLESTSSASARKAIFEEINQLRKQKDVLWWQRSRTEFLKFVDHNSTWFHRKANMRRVANQITELKDTNGQSYHKAHDLERIIVAYFGDLFYFEWTGRIEHALGKDMIKSIFYPVDDDIILFIPLCTFWPNYKLTWLLEPSRVCTIKSTYRLILQEYSINAAWSSTGINQAFWKIFGY
ncbi:hypothetical protein Cgig2_027779 [Carnegiea gigantea]|uniref:Uncharacterized protein n=1 Tax=Carnegiea gigantea TaxID=171969 RepID=A0A9Q1H107_9CARY|nr:hypothetical protein Cgig2_027779 [Carnegiea gigantea]